MARPQSKVTARGQVSVPAEIRRKLGIGPGSVLEWEAQGDKIVVRRVMKYSCEDIHRALFPDDPPRRRSIEEMDEGIAQYIRKKHARS